MKKILLTAGILSTLIFSSCSQDFLNTQPESTINDDQLETSSAGLTGLIDGIYTSLHSTNLSVVGSHEDSGHKSVLAAMDMMSNDNMMTKSHWYGSFYSYLGRVESSTRSRLMWYMYYPQIKICNFVINAAEANGINASNKYAYAQAKALRAYMYFMLARIYGPTFKGNLSENCIPIYLQHTFTGRARATVSEVYNLIKTDLTTSIGLLDGFERLNKEKINKSVAQAFLAQVALEMGDYALAASSAHAARISYIQPSEVQWKSGFYDLDAVPDAMWGCYINQQNTTFVNSFFAHFDNTNINGYAGGLAVYKGIDRRLYDLIPVTDYRKSVFQGTAGAAPYTALPKYASTKFVDRTPSKTEGDYIYLRASEMYYIEAEALARVGNEVGAKDVLNEIELLRNPSFIAAETGSALIDKIILQKRIEMWGEGCAWFDMKRLGVGLVRDYVGSNHVAFGKKDYPANSPKFIFQIPQAEMLANPLMVQNPE